MAITVNKEPMAWREGLTVEALLEERKFSFPMKTVFVNGRRIPKVEQATTILRDGDQVDVVHLMGGG